MIGKAASGRQPIHKPSEQLRQRPGMQVLVNGCAGCRRECRARALKLAFHLAGGNKMQSVLGGEGEEKHLSWIFKKHCL